MSAHPITLAPLTGPPRLAWRVPGSKSITNRALVLAALCPGPTRIEGALSSDDTGHMGRALSALGIAVASPSPDVFVVQGGVARLHEPADPLFVGNSGTTVRFLAAVCALVPGRVGLVGDEHMARRPIADLVDALGQLGVEVECPTGCPPLWVSGRHVSSGHVSHRQGAEAEGSPLAGGRVSMRGDRSSQYLSALLMAGTQAAQPIEIAIEGSLVSRPYVEMTATMIRAFGGACEVEAASATVHPSALHADSYAVEPDASAASYAWATAAATGGEVGVPGLGAEVMQGDVAFADVLAKMGCRVARRAGALVVQGGPLVGVDVDMEHISDTAMTLAALAPLAAGPTTIRNVGNIRLKETDRLSATVNELRRLGQEVEEGPDWLRIDPRPLRPATIECYSDHRMAMSFAVLGLARPGVTIADPSCVSKTYPGFWRDLCRVYETIGMTPPDGLPREGDGR